MSLKGKKVCFTGKLSKSRAKMKAEAEAAGADAVSSISGNTDYLVMGVQVASNSENTKYNEALEHDVEILSEDEYRALLGSVQKTKKKAPAKKKSTKKKTSDKAEEFFTTLSKSRLTNIMDDLGDEDYRSSWTKAKLVTQLLTHGVDDILETFTSAELKEGLEELAQSTSGKKADRLARLKDAIS